MIRTGVNVTANYLSLNEALIIKEYPLLALYIKINVSMYIKK